MKTLCSAVTLTVFVVANLQADEVRLMHKRASGSYSMHTTSRFEQVLTLADMDLETVTENSVVLRSTTGDPKEDGSITVDTAVQSLKVDLALPGGLSLKFDSRAPDDAEAAAGLEFVPEALRAFSTASWSTVYDAKLQPQNVTVHIEGLDGLSPTAAQLTRDQADPEALKRADVEELARCPDRPVSPGDQWMRTEHAPLGQGQTLVSQVRYRYAGSEEVDGRTLDRLEVEVTEVELTVDAGAASPLTLTDSDLDVTASKGTMWFDRELGRFVRAENLLHLAGDLTFDAGGVELDGSVDLVIKSAMASAE